VRKLKGLRESKLIKELDDVEGYYTAITKDHLTYRYEILKVLGKGSFAQVLSCLDHKTGKKVAVKVTRNTEIDHKFALSESRLLNILMEKDPYDSHNIVRMMDEFTFREHHCFVFELLYSDLFEYLKENDFTGFSTDKIRGYAIQLLEALIFLESHNLIHCDLKPENILLVDKEGEKLKMVDFGSGCFKSEQVYTYV
jgi:dual specificity tyrosine-phosphorylation-regulated kinase 2/3/4